MVKCRFCCTKSSNVKEPRLSPQLFFSLPDACSARPPVIYIRSPLAYAYAELNAHGARHARPLSFARMEVLRTSQDRQIELSLSLDFFASLNAKEPRLTPQLFYSLSGCASHPSDRAVELKDYKYNFNSSITSFLTPLSFISLIMKEVSSMNASVPILISLAMSPYVI